MSIIANNLLQGDEGYNIARSLRFRASASAYLSRTPASSSNRKTWSFSAWVKRGSLGALQNTIFSAGPWTNPNQLTAFAFATDNTLTIASGFYGVSTDYTLNTAPVFRDPSAWYHLVLVYDTTQATASNRVKLYCNGVQQTLTGSYPALNYDTAVNSTLIQKIGMGAGSELFDGYLTDINFIDGQALTPSSFGEFDTTTGVWKPKKYAGTYGTNGFYLPFSDNSSTTTLGYDKSGNSNNWTCNNISLTAGATYDSMTDVPTLSALGSNYCVLNPLDKGTSFSISNGNLTADINASRPVFASVKGTFGIASGKYYWEFVKTSSGSGLVQSGVWASDNLSVNVNTDLNGSLGSLTNIGMFGATSSNAIIKTGLSTQDASTLGSYINGDVIGIAFDADSGKLYAYKNGTEFTGQAIGSGTSILPTMATGKTYQPFVYSGNGGSGTETATTNINFGQRPFAYTPPTGFVALNTFNLPEPSIKQGNKHFDATLYTGNGSTPRAITGLGFQPSFTWIKSRSGADNHNLQDSVRGANKTLRSDSTLGETIETQNLISFDSAGFTVGSGNGVNINGGSFVAWNWKANGSAVSNTAGSITSQVSANPSAGFSVVTYTGSGVNGATVGHGLGVAPKMIFVKDRSQGGTYRDWAVYSPIIGAGNSMYLNSTSGSFSKPSYWNSTTATSSVFTLGNDITVNQSGDNFVAYCFAEVAGYSKFGSYTGNGSDDGPFIHLGFRPKFWLIKNASSGYNWIMVDTTRNTSNITTQWNWLYPNLSNAEGQPTKYIDILSNGVKLRGSGADINENGSTHIYMAFAENPFKYSLAR